MIVERKIAAGHMADAEALLQSPMGRAQPGSLVAQAGFVQFAGPVPFEGEFQLASAADAREAKVAGNGHAGRLPPPVHPARRHVLVRRRQVSWLAGRRPCPTFPDLAIQWPAPVRGRMGQRLAADSCGGSRRLAPGPQSSRGARRSLFTRSRGTDDCEVVPRAVSEDKWPGGRRRSGTSGLAIMDRGAIVHRVRVGVEIFKTKWFVRFVRRQGIADASLVEAIERADRGLIDADLGGGLIKQRVARPGQGRSGGHRMLIAYRAGDRAVFLYGFAKNKRDNIATNELLTLREIGAVWLDAAPRDIDRALIEGILQEVTDGDEQAT